MEDKLNGRKTQWNTNSVENKLRMTKNLLLIEFLGLVDDNVGSTNKLNRSICYEEDKITGKVSYMQVTCIMI